MIDIDNKKFLKSLELCLYLRYTPSHGFIDVNLIDNKALYIIIEPL